MDSKEDLEITGIAGIEEAGPGELTFVSNRKYIRHIKETKASAIILGLDLPEIERATLRAANPYLAFAKALELFYAPMEPVPDIHPTAIIADDAEIGQGASIGAYVVIASGCRVGSGVVMYPHVILYPKVSVGDNVILHSGVIIREQCIIGDRVIIQNGTVIGSDGFGFVPLQNGSYYKIRQTGRVVIEEDVEIGSNCSIDRAAIGETRICRGAKIDNLVQVGHGARVGENSVLAAQVGLAGSTRLGRNVQAGGQAGFAGHQEIGDRAIIMAQSGVHGEVAAGAVISGSPAFDSGIWRRSVVLYPKLPDLQRQIRTIEKEIESLKRQIPEKS
jgi:UDP-3-O-[3-hydroxymyristoyl] glucosamine N-acyltransferase